MTEIVEADEHGNIIKIINTKTGEEVNVKDFFEKGSNVFNEIDGSKGLFSSMHKEGSKKLF